MRDFEIDSNHADAVNDGIAEDAAARVILNKSDRDSAVSASRARVEEESAATEIAFDMDGTDETVDAYLPELPYDLANATPAQRRQIHVVKQEIKEEFDL
jgi:hypothetical protein